jgi:flagella basal body P-ring formation protein FlgA
MFFLFGSGIGFSETNSLLEKHLIDQIKKIYGEVNDMIVQFHNLPRDIEDEKSVKGVVITRLPDRKGDGQAVIEIEEKPKRKRNVYVSFRVLTMKRFYLAKRDMKKGERIKGEDLYERVAFLSDYGLYPSSIEDIEGKRLKRDILANTPITKEILEETYAVGRGEIVTVKIENERIKISAKAISLEKGKLGDVVRLKNTSSGKEITGLVSGEREVTIIF